MFMCIILGEYFQPILDLSFLPFFVAGIQIQGTTLQIGHDAPIEKAGHEGGAEERGDLPGLINPQKRWPSPEVLRGFPVGFPYSGQTPIEVVQFSKLLSHRDSQPEQLLSYANPANINQVQK